MRRPEMPVPTEHQTQCVIVDEIEIRWPRLYANLTAIPHGGERHPAVAGKLKKEGVRKGYPDILIDLPRGPFHGLRVETKRNNCTPSDIKKTQREWGDRLNAAGYLAIVGRGQDRAILQIAAYWNLGQFNPGGPCTVAAIRGRFELLCTV